MYSNNAKKTQIIAIFAKNSQIMPGLMPDDKRVRKKESKTLPDLATLLLVPIGRHARSRTHTHTHTHANTQQSARARTHPRTSIIITIQIQR